MQTTDFSGYPDGSAWPSPWIPASSGTGSATVQGGTGRLTTGDAGGWSSADKIAIQDPTSRGNFSLFFEMTAGADTYGQTPHLVIRNSGAAIESADRVEIKFEKNQILVREVSAGVATLRATVPLTGLYSGTHRVRVNANGTALSLKAWPIASTEPAAWASTVTLATAPAAGSIGFLVVGSSAPAHQWVELDNIIVDAAGALPLPLVYIPRVLPTEPKRRGWSFFATRLHGDGTETVLAVDLPLTSPTLVDELSGPDTFTAVVAPEIQSLKTDGGGPLFSPYSTAIYVEYDGIIRHGTILTSVAPNDSELSISGIGFSGYLEGLPWTNSIKKLYDADPAEIVRTLWKYAQMHPRGNIGLELTPSTLSTKVRLGVRVAEVKKGDNVITEAQDEPVLLANYATHNMGQLMDEVLAAGSIDYTERHTRQPNGTIRHELLMAHPRLGTRRTDIRFVIGENVVPLPAMDLDFTDFATEVLVIGAGEGDKMIRGHAYNPDPGEGIRRVAVQMAKHIGRTATALSSAASRAKALQRGTMSVNEITVYDHPNAPLLSWTVGDEVRLTGDAGWAGHIDMFVRVLSSSYSPTNHAASATLRVAPAGRT